MKKILLSGFLIAALFVQQAGAQTAEQLHASGKTFLMQGDFANASLILNRSLSMSPKNIEVIKDLAQSYYFSGDNDKAKATIKPALDLPDADDQCYQIAGNIYKQIGDKKTCEKIYKQGLKKFPKSGPLYNELGELQVLGQGNSDIKSWEKGIEVDPSYSRNYYNAARYYFYTPNIVWSVIYSEMFINMEPAGRNTGEIKQLLSEGYKKLFANADVTKGYNTKNEFTTTYLQIMNQQSPLAASGITSQSLTAIRKNFITQWYAVTGRPAFRLFEHQKQLIENNMFDAYNKWLFSPAEDLNGYTNWIKAHKTEMDAFVDFQRSKIFKVPDGQYYP